MTSLINFSATKLVAGLREKKFSCVELMQEFLKRIADINPKLNAIVQQLPYDIAIQQAETADKQLAKKQSVGKLHGLPITVKDHLKVKNFVVTRGSLAFKDYYCDTDAPIVAKLKQEGAIIIGITNMPELGPVFETDNDIYGRTLNPYDLNKTPGGSSGGEAAIIASAGSSFGIGSDGAGSIRVPAHFSGIAGIKPTQHLVSCAGNVPADGGIAARLYSPGPMAKRVEDLRLVLPIISGWDGVDPHTFPVKLATSCKPLHQMRVGYLTKTNSIDPTPETQNIMENALKELSSAVSEIVEIDFLDIDYIAKFHWETFFYGGDQAKSYIDGLKNAGVAKASAALQRFFDAAAESETFDITELRKRILQADQIRMQALQNMKQLDAIILPACASPAKPHGTTQRDIKDFQYTMAFNLLGWPGTVVRCGQSQTKLPIGLQVVAKPWEDYTTLAIAEYLEDIFGGWQAPSYL